MWKQISLIGVPSAYGQPHQGVAQGPIILRQLGLQTELRSLGWQVQDHGNLFLPKQGERQAGGVLKNLEVITSISQYLYSSLLPIVKKGGYFPLILGGDHSISIGSIAALAHERSLGVIWFDAHPDLNTPKTSPSGNIHGMSLAIALGLGHPKLVELGMAIPKLKPEQVVIIGARAIDKGEADLIARKDITVYTMADIEKLGIKQVVKRALLQLKDKTDGIHLSLDLDAIDPIVAPGVGTPEPGGISLQDSKRAMEILNRSGLLTSLEVVELNPTFDKDNQTALVALDLIGTLFERGSYLQRQDPV